MNEKIGDKIKEVFDQRQMKLKDFAEKIGVARQNVYRIFEKDSIDTDLLLKITETLNHNFFQYFKNSPTGSNGKSHTLQSPKENGIDYYKNELKLAKKEIDYLKKIIELMEERTKLLLGKKLE